jgi:hypothetical protein
VIPNLTLCSLTLIAQEAKEFLLYNNLHDKCISIENETVTARSCNPITDNQRWRWTRYYQLRNSFSETCLSAPRTPDNFDPVKLSTCDPNDKYQVWVCVGDIVRLIGTKLHLNYGKGNDNVVLYRGIGNWSIWNVYGEDVPVCEKRPQGTKYYEQGYSI